MCVWELRAKEGTEPVQYCSECQLVNNSITLFTVQKILSPLASSYIQGPSELRCDYGTQFPRNYITVTVLQEQWCSRTPGPLPLAIRLLKQRTSCWGFKKKKKKGCCWCQPEQKLVSRKESSNPSVPQSSSLGSDPSFAESSILNIPFSMPVYGSKHLSVHSFKRANLTLKLH